MAGGVDAIDFDEIQALIRMTERPEPFVAKIAKATLAVVESCRDAQMRGAAAEVALSAEQAKLAAVRHILASLPERDADFGEMLRQIGRVVG